MDVLDRLLHTPTSKDLKSDTTFVIGAAIGWTLLREVAVRLLLRPVAAKYVISVSPDEVTSGKAEPTASSNGGTVNGHTSPPADGKKRTASPSRPLSTRQRRRQEHLQQRNEARFSEQGWSVLYYSSSFLLGLYISVHQPWWPFNVKHFWTDYPEVQVSVLLKYYYLGQTGFYVHQMFVLFSEARRKDHWQMFAHHVITVGLQYASYATHFHRVGVAIMLLLDPCDILLSAAKMLRYVGFQTVCDIFFGLFLLSWLLFRHILFGAVIWSAILDVPRHPNPDIKAGDYSMLFVTNSLIGLLVMLQCLLLIWFGMIVKVAYRVVTGSGAADTRSDDEDDLDFSEDLDDEENASENGHVATSAHNGVKPTATAPSGLRQRANA
ncbi:hypothetical protein V8E36_002772 [Tilletia maclaganii]